MLYDEQGVSGRVLAKRAQALSLLMDIRRGNLDGLYAHDIGRLTRDESGADADNIVRILAVSRAPLITSRETFRLWLPEDALRFRREAARAGREVTEIRDTLYGGLLTRARHEPFFRSTPPFGYTTRIEEVPAQRHGESCRVRRIPVKDAEAGPAMDHIRSLLDAGRALGDAATDLNALGLRPTTRKGRQRGVSVLWDARRLRYMLENPIYSGVWIFGRTRRTSTMWDSLGIRDERLRHEVPELAYWTWEQAQAWLAMCGKGTRTRGPQQPYDRPLKGLLICIACGRTMLSAGAEGYQCPMAKHGRGASTHCPRAQRIAHHHAMRLLRAAVPDVVQGCTNAEELVSVRFAQQVGVDALGLRIDTTRERIERLLLNRSGSPARPVAPSRATEKNLTRTVQELQRLQKQAARAYLEAEVTAQAKRTIGTIVTSGGSNPPLESLPEAVQASVFRLLFADVRIRTGGWAKRRTYHLASYRNLLTGRTRNVI